LTSHALIFLRKRHYAFACGQYHGPSRSRRPGASEDPLIRRRARDASEKRLQGFYFQFWHADDLVAVCVLRRFQEKRDLFMTYIPFSTRKKKYGYRTAGVDSMLTKKEYADCIYNVLTAHDLHEKMKAVVAAAKNPDIIINYGNGHFLIGHKKYRDGLAISTDGFGVWEITGLTSTEDKSYEFTEKVLKTENTETVVRALASLLITWEENQ
jgi:hypothetical protein